jgi:hypothetical protein
MNRNTIPVQCPAGHSFEVPLSFQGLTRRCPACGMKTVVPGESPDQGESPDESGDQQKTGWNKWFYEKMGMETAIGLKRRCHQCPSNATHYCRACDLGFCASCRASRTEERRSRGKHGEETVSQVTLRCCSGCGGGLVRIWHTDVLLLLVFALSALLIASIVLLILAVSADLNKN